MICPGAGTLSRRFDLFDLPTDHCQTQSEGHLCDNFFGLQDRINDDYCDCDDSKDEPGTSACQDGSFWCKNRGFEPHSIHSSVVGDTKCDCCDGSDEAEGVCADNCLAAGQSAREAVLTEAELHSKGVEIKAGWIAEAAIAKAALAASHIELEAKVTPLEIVVEELKARKTLAEEREQAEVDRRAAEKEHKICVEHGVDVAQYIADPNATIPEEWIIETDGEWTAPQVKNPAYERACQEAKDERKVKKEAEEELKKAEEEAAKAEADKAEETAASEKTETVEEQTMDEAAADEPNANERHALAADATKKEEPNANERHALQAETPTPDPPPPPPEEPPPPPPEVEEKYEDEEAKELRREFNQKNGELSKAKEAANEVKIKLETDYGPGDAYYQLREQCIELQLNQYKYSVCPYGEVKQDNTLLGKWDSWLEPHRVMHFKDGQNCWNIGAREARVELRCGLENKLVAAEEPGPCKYLMKVETPAACDSEHAESLRYKHAEMLRAHTADEL